VPVSNAPGTVMAEKGQNAGTVKKFGVHDLGNIYRFATGRGQAPQGSIRTDRIQMYVDCRPFIRRERVHMRCMCNNVYIFFCFVSIESKRKTRPSIKNLSSLQHGRYTCCTSRGPSPSL